MNWPRPRAFQQPLPVLPTLNTRFYPLPPPPPGPLRVALLRRQARRAVRRAAPPPRLQKRRRARRRRRRAPLLMMMTKDGHWMTVEDAAIGGLASASRRHRTLWAAAMDGRRPADITLTWGQPKWRRTANWIKRGGRSRSERLLQWWCLECTNAADREDYSDLPRAPKYLPSLPEMAATARSRYGS